MDTRSPPGEFGLSHIPHRGTDHPDRHRMPRHHDETIPAAKPMYRSPRRLVLWTVSLSTVLWGLSAMVVFWWIY